MSLLEVRSVSKYYGDLKVLDNISLKVDRGEIHALLGPNGAGKTTLLSIVCGIVNPSEGYVSIEGLSPKDSNTRKIIGIMPQEESLYEDLTGEENILFFAGLYGIDGKNAKSLAEELLTAVGLGKWRNKLVKTYSGGMKKRLSLSVALINDPELLILDEPTTGMDPGMRQETWNIIRERKKEGKAILLATHYMDEAESLADKVTILNEGKIIAEGTVSELKAKYGPPSVIEIELASPLKDIPNDLKEEMRIEIDEDRRQLRAFVDDPHLSVPRLVDKLYEVGMHVKTLRVREPSLEDVFLNLTGRRLGE